MFSKLSTSSTLDFTDLDQKFFAQFSKTPNFFSFFEQLHAFKENHPHESIEQAATHFRNFVDHYTPTFNIDPLTIMESFLGGLHPRAQILVRAQAPHDLTSAITLAINVEAFF